MFRGFILLTIALMTLNAVHSPSVASSSVPMVSYTLGATTVFATHDTLAGYGFAWGPSDGTLGAIPQGGTNYLFYAPAGSSSSCPGTPNLNGAYTFTGTLDQITGSDGCKRLFGPGSGPSGWKFDANYSGGGQVVRFEANDQTGWLMVFHAEEWWLNQGTSNGKCNNVSCFYSSLGLAVSTDNGKTFRVVGQILQPSQPMSVFQGGGRNMAVGTGSLVVADANGKHLDNPPPDPSAAYFYLFYTDLSPGMPGPCANGPCIGVARAPYLSLIQTALAGNPDLVATAFHKYGGPTPSSWTQPATSGTPNQSGTAGVYSPLWTDESIAQPEVIYDRALNVYLAVYETKSSIGFRASYDLINWSGPLGSGYSETGRQLYAPTLLGETGDPTIAGSTPRLYFTSFPSNSFPNWKTSTFETLQLNLSGTPDPSQTETAQATTITSTQNSGFGNFSVLVAVGIIAVAAVVFAARYKKRSS